VTAYTAVQAKELNVSLGYAANKYSVGTYLRELGGLAHTQNTDTGTTSNNLTIGDGTDTTKTIYVSNGDLNPPGIRYDHTNNVWQSSNDGVNWYNIVLPTTDSLSEGAVNLYYTDARAQAACHGYFPSGW